MLSINHVSRLISGLVFIGYLSWASLVTPQTWNSTGSMGTSRRHATSTQLLNGKILIVGGVSTTGTDLSCNAGSCTFFASAELYDPATGTFTPTGNLTSGGRALHTATLLGNGKVLIAGGFTPALGSFPSAELYDPATGTFTATGFMAFRRSQHTSTLLNNGKVLIAAGFGKVASDEFSPETSLTSAEEYDPTLGAFSPTAGNLGQDRNTHTATPLLNGRVLIVGGYGSGGALASTELYDPVTRTFSATGPLGQGRGSHRATLLANGTVLVTGGNSNGVLSSAEKYDPGANTFAPAGNLNQARQWHEAVLLSNGQVLVAGGNNSASGHWDVQTNFLSSAELYDPVANTFTSTSSMSAARSAASAALLSTGKVLVAGGGSNTAELYSNDTDSDGVPDGVDNAPFVYNPNQEDSDNDGVGDVADNCPDNSNADQADGDQDLLGTSCDDKTHTASLPGGNTVAPGTPFLVTFNLAVSGTFSGFMVRPDCVNIFQDVRIGGSQVSPRERYKPVIIPDDLVAVSPGQNLSVTCNVLDAVSPGVLTPGNYQVTGFYGSDFVDPDIVNGVCTFAPCFTNIFRGVIRSNTVNFAVSETPPAASVEIDIKPGTFPNDINLEKKGTLPVAILGTASFNVKQIVVSSLRLAGAAVATRGKGDFQVSFEDVNGDGFVDLVAHFEVGQLQLNLRPGQTETIAVLTGTMNNAPFAASDSLIIVKN